MNTMNKLQRNYLSTPDAEYEESNRRSYRRSSIIDFAVIIAWFAFIAAVVAAAVLIDWSKFGPEW